MLTSVQNPRIKDLKNLHQKKHRDREKVFFIEGVRFVEEALASGVPVKLMVHSPKLASSLRGLELLSRAEKAAIELLEVSDHVLGHLAGTENPQGVWAVLPQPEQGNIPPKDGIILLVDGVQDPGNLGTIIRTADAAGARAVLLGAGTVELYNPKTLRSTMGSIFHLPIINVNAVEALTEMRKEGWQVAVADTEGEQEWFTIDLSQPTVIVIGSEARGPAEELVRLADYRVCITMPGLAESLNVAVATGVLLFEAVRQNNHLL